MFNYKIIHNMLEDSYEKGKVVSAQAKADLAFDKARAKQKLDL